MLGPLIGWLPAWLRWRVYSRLVGDPFAPGPDQAVVRRVGPHGYRMILNRSDWLERYAADCGWFYDAGTVGVLELFIKPGAVVVDVGANVGFTVLTAAALAGPSGRVAAFEPNPIAADRLRANLDRNGLSNVELHRVALAAEAGELHLDVGDHHGAGSLRTGAGQLVPVRRGDDFAFAPDFIKIDVEGFEFQALRGFAQTIERHRPTVMLEVTSDWLKQVGDSAEAIFDFMQAFGYEAWAPRLLHSGAVDLVPLTGPLNVTQFDVLFAHPSQIKDSRAFAKRRF